MRALDRIPRTPREIASDDVRQRLRDLPCEDRLPYDFTEFRHRSRERRWPRLNAVKWEHAAMAASVTLLVASMAMWSRTDHHKADLASSGVTMIPMTADPIGPADTAEDPTEDTTTPGSQGAAALAVQAAVATQFAALARSQGSRRWLETQPAEPAIVRVGPRLVVSTLEDRIAWVDDALSDARFGKADGANLRTLEYERARLVSSLAQVRYAETLAAQVN